MRKRHIMGESGREGGREGVLEREGERGRRGRKRECGGKGGERGREGERERESERRQRENAERESWFNWYNKKKLFLPSAHWLLKFSLPFQPLVVFVSKWQWNQRKLARLHGTLGQRDHLYLLWFLVQII